MDYYKVDERIHRVPKATLSWAQKLFYSRLSFRCNHKNLSWWSKKKLAADFQTTPRNIQRWWWHLEQLGLIKIHSQEGSEHEISINELTEELLANLGVPEMSREGRQKCLGRGDGSVSPIRKGKDKTKKKTDGRATVASLWGDSDVAESGARAVAASKKRGAMPAVGTDLPPEMASTPEEPALPDEARLGRWTYKHWSDEFVIAMNGAGFGVAFQKYKTIHNHVGAIKDHLINRGFSRLKIYRFLLEWFPKAYPDIRSSVFKKSEEDLMFSVSWMEPRLDELVRLFENKDDESSWDSMVTVMD